MADQPAQDKTEQPTPKRREDAKDKGNVAKSRELNSVAVLIGGMLAIKFTSDYFSQTVKMFFRNTYIESSLMQITVQSLPGQLSKLMLVVASLLLPILVTVLVFGLASNIGQIGFMMAKKALIPDFKRINPLSGIKRMFSSRSLVELAKGVLKVVILALVSYLVLTKYQDEYLLLATQTPSEIISFFVSVFFELTIKVTIALLIMAVGDYAYQKYQHEKELKMTKQEVKDEMKNQEGDPKVRSRIKSEQRKMVASRMMQAVPEATVVVTNPTHIAVALKYDPQSSADAPKVIAKGKRKLAEKIKKIAREHGVPVIENKPLARGLYEYCEVGMEIPIVFYQTVAEILSKIYSENKKRLPRLGGING